MIGPYFSFCLKCEQDIYFVWLMPHEMKCISPQKKGLPCFQFTLYDVMAASGWHLGVWRSVVEDVKQFIYNLCISVILLITAAWGSSSLVAWQVSNLGTRVRFRVGIPLDVCLILCHLSIWSHNLIPVCFWAFFVRKWHKTLNHSFRCDSDCNSFFFLQAELKFQIFLKNSKLYYTLY